MKHDRMERRKQGRKKPIKTTFLELIQELSSLTSDDSLVVAAVMNIFETYNVRLSRSLLSVRLATAGNSISGYRASRWEKDYSSCA